MTRVEQPAPERLAAIFLAHVPEARRARFAGTSDLEGALAKLVAKGRTAWPEIALDEADFAAFLGRRLPEDAADEIAALRGDDLWIACAYGVAVPGAADVVERHCLARIAARLGRLGAEPALVADVLQELRQSLFQMRAPRVDQKSYAGRGSLVAWLRVVAVRGLSRRRGRRAREVPLEASPTQVTSPEQEPETALLHQTYKRELTEAFREALASLPIRDRSVLRYSFIEAMSIDRIAHLYGVHRATAARWVERARATLAERTREAFQRRVSISTEGFQRIIDLIESQVTVGLAAAEP